MKKIVLIVSVIASSLNFAMSQASISPSEKAKNLTAKFSTVVGLSKEQQNQMITILTDFYVSADKYATMRTSNKEAYAEKMLPAKSIRDKKMHELLTKEQEVSFQNFRKKEVAEGKNSFEEFAK